MKSIVASSRSLVHRARSAFGACLALALVLVPLAVAGSVSAFITGDTVTYSVSGIEPDTKHTVTITNTSSGQAKDHQQTSTSEGTIPQSTGSTGGEIPPGTTVNVEVKTLDGDVVASTSITKPQGDSGVVKLIKAFVKGIIPFL